MDAPVSANTSWVPRTRSGTVTNTSGSNRASPERGPTRSRTSWMATEPHSPHDDVVVPNLGCGTGARPPVSTVTTLYAVSDAEPVAQ